MDYSLIGQSTISVAIGTIAPGESKTATIELKIPNGIHNNTTVTVNARAQAYDAQCGIQKTNATAQTTLQGTVLLTTAKTVDIMAITDT